MKSPYSPKPLLEISNKFQYNSMRCTLCPVHELTRETKEIDCGKCDSYTRCCKKNLKINLFLANNSMATDHFNLKKTETCFRACLKSIFLCC